MRHRQVDAVAQSLGYRRIGGRVTNRVYLHTNRAEVLKVAIATDSAMLYTFLLGPEAQVKPRYRQHYAAIKPLRAFWAALAPRLLADLGISVDELRHAVVFRMGNGWLYQLARALEHEDTARATELERDLRDLVSGRCFDILPYP